ncbi:C-GCAxxG-C-C family protein [Geoalkalibacter sp.]|uniref:C-GCAxxG-C-C family protein n=1 Tax=Geoalkalibacter sp. TaxID=3041440 RepID=UPI00272E83DD|nr:C-GCAxxG-C-C family protein [Geoalkalibacter sp.]
MIGKILRFKKKIPLNASAGEKAGALYASGYNCAQAVFEATTGNDDPGLMKMAKAFGGGIGGSKCLCGAVTGGVMALSHLDRGDLAARLVEEFKKQRRMTCCSGLTKGFVWKSRDHLDHCRRITEETAQMVARLLHEE